MRRLTRWGVAAAIVVSIGVLPLAPAQASVLGPTVTDAQYEWVPRTGVVKVTAMLRCRKVEFNAHWGVELSQGKVQAEDRKQVRCDGEFHRSRLVLDPRKGRFHPGKAVALKSSGACESDFCWELELLVSDFRIPPPGHTVRGAR